LATTEKVTIVVAQEADGKTRVTSGSWEGEKVFLRDQALEVRNVDGWLHVARKPRHHDEWDPPRTGTAVTGDAVFVTADDFVVMRNAASPLRITRLS
jgi:hypothetical protein